MVASGAAGDGAPVVLLVMLVLLVLLVLLMMMFMIMTLLLFLLLRRLLFALLQLLLPRWRPHSSSIGRTAAVFDLTHHSVVVRRVATGVGVECAVCAVCCVAERRAICAFSRLGRATYVGSSPPARPMRAVGHF